MNSPNLICSSFDSDCNLVSYFISKYVYYKFATFSRYLLTRFTSDSVRLRVTYKLHSSLHRVTLPSWYNDCCIWIPRLVPLHKTSQVTAGVIIYTCRVCHAWGLWKILHSAFIWKVLNHISSCEGKRRIYFSDIIPVLYSESSNLKPQKEEIIRYF
jgi:hypothetical protein